MTIALSNLLNKRARIESPNGERFRESPLFDTLDEGRQLRITLRKSF